MKLTHCVATSLALVAGARGQMTPTPAMAPQPYVPPFAPNTAPGAAPSIAPAPLAPSFAPAPSASSTPSPAPAPVPSLPPAPASGPLTTCPPLPPFVDACIFTASQQDAVFTTIQHLHELFIYNIRVATADGQEREACQFDLTPNQQLITDVCGVQNGYATYRAAVRNFGGQP